MDETLQSPAEPDTTTAVEDAPQVGAASVTDDAAKNDAADDVGATPSATKTSATKTPATETSVEKTPSVNVDDIDVDEAPPEQEEKQWYVLKVASNRERTIKVALERQIKREDLSDYFGEILIPTEKVKETKNGKMKIREVKLWPGYLVVQMQITDDTYSLVRGVTGVGDFTGAAGKPVAMTVEEVSRLKGEEIPAEQKAAEKDEEIVVKVPYDEGQRVKVKEGPFESFEGTVDSIDQHTGKIKILVEIFGRPTEMELEHWQVEKL